VQRGLLIDHVEIMIAAIKAIFLAIRTKPKYVLNADISKCFNCINYKALLNPFVAFCTELLASLTPFLLILFLDAPYALPIWELKHGFDLLHPYY